MKTNLSEMANELSDIIGSEVNGTVLRYEDLDAEDVAEFSIEFDDGRRCMACIVPHPDD